MSFRKTRKTTVPALMMAGGLALLTAGCGGIAPPPMAPPDPATLATLDRFVSNDCNPVAASALTGIGIPASDIRGANYGIYRDEFRDIIVRWDAWVYLHSQPGAVVVTMDEDCRPIQIYAREGATLPGRR
ncbi:hypothetical protein [Azospirillum thiophilum]|nr:hypothetical protein [Azospirillum thiophilum]